MTIVGPTWVYHRTEPPKLLKTQAEYDALGPGWCDSPVTAARSMALVAPTPLHVPPRRPRGRPRKDAASMTVQ